MEDRALGDTLLARMGGEYLEATPERVVARLPVEGNTQPYGLLHGGATAVLCETAGSIGSALAAGPGFHAMGIELNVNHLRAVRSGHITATAVPLHVGRTTAVWEIKVRDDDGRLVAAARLTCVIRPARPPAGASGPGASESPGGAAR